MLVFFPPCDNEQSGWPQVLCAGPLNSSSVSMRSAATWWRHSVAWWAGGGAPVLSRKRNLRWYVVAGPYQMNQSSSWTLKTLWVFGWLVFSGLRRVPWVTSCIFSPLFLWQYFVSMISGLLVVAWIGQQVHNLLLTYIIGECVDAPVVTSSFITYFLSGLQF